MKNLIILILVFSCSVAYAQNFNKKFLENNWTTFSVNGNKAKVSDDAIVIGFTEEKLLLGNISTPYKLNGSKITFNAGPKKVVWEILKLTKKQLVIKEEEGRIIKMKAGKV
jgi:hypothetical protein